MFGKIVLLASVVAITTARKNPLEGVDPNSLSCDPKGQVFLLLPSYDECSKFFMCTHGEEIEFTCPGGLWFDFVNQVCNWPSDTNCKLRTHEEDEVDGEGSGDDSEWEQYNSDLKPFSKQTTLNCADPTSTKSAPYRDDCQRFWRCSNGVAEAAYCSDGLYFNPKSLQCDFEANVPCTRDAHEEIGEEFIRY